MAVRDPEVLVEIFVVNDSELDLKISEEEPSEDSDETRDVSSQGTYNNGSDPDDILVHVAGPSTAPLQRRGLGHGLRRPQPIRVNRGGKGHEDSIYKFDIN